MVGFRRSVIAVEFADAPQSDQASLPAQQQEAEISFDTCIFEQPCQNGATCERGTDGNSYVCRCMEGYTGKCCTSLVGFL